MSIIPTQSDLFQTLENGLDGKPGGILITSIGEQITDYIWLGGFRTLESREFLEDNQIKHVLSLGHFKRCKPPIEVNHKVSNYLFFFSLLILLHRSLLSKMTQKLT